MTIIFFFSIGSFFISVLVNKFLLYYLNRRGVMDIPNERSSHKIPTPRGGGIGIVAGVLVMGTIFAITNKDLNILLIIFLSFIIGIVGFIDDVRKGLHTGLRFGIQLFCSLVIIYFFNPVSVLPLPDPLNIHLGYLGILISIIWLIGITNIFNFLDGIDGYAGTQGFIGGLMLAIISWGTPISAIGLFIALSSAGFLLFNWHPAKIFMGDVGSSFLGFLFAALPFYLKDLPGTDSRTQLFFGTGIILWFFLLDGSFTILRRLLKREKVWQAHRSHLYQRLVISGISHNMVVLTVCFFYTILYSFLIFYTVRSKSSIMQWSTLMCGLILFMVFLFYTIYIEKKSKTNSTNQPK